jgi:hypothetical protein
MINLHCEIEHKRFKEFGLGSGQHMWARVINQLSMEVEHKSWAQIGAPTARLVLPVSDQIFYQVSNDKSPTSYKK